MIKSYNGKSYLHYPDIQDGVRSDNMVQTEAAGIGQTEESVMRGHMGPPGTHNEERKLAAGEKGDQKDDRGLVKSASSHSSMAIIGGSTLHEILGAAQIRETEGTPDKQVDMSAIRVNNFPFRGILTSNGERGQRNIIKDVAFSANSTKSTQKIVEIPTVYIKKVNNQTFSKKSQVNLQSTPSSLMISAYNLKTQQRESRAKNAFQTAPQSNIPSPRSDDSMPAS